jgi:polysaccharide pyruvyl transferase CsaB
MRLTKMYKVFLIGTNGQNNLGDDLLLKIHLDKLGIDPIINSTNPKLTKNMFNLKEVVPTFNIYKIIKTINKSEYLIFGGGSILKELNQSVGRNKYATLFNILILITFAKLFRKKIIMSSIGVGPLKSKMSYYLTKLIAKKCDYLSVRDKKSMEILKSLEINKIKYYADPVFLMDASKNKNKAKRVGIFPVYNDDGIYTFDELSYIFSNLINYLTDELNLQVSLIPFQPSANKNNDLLLCKNILKKIKNKNKINIEKINMGNAFDLFKKLDFCIPMRYHSLILAIISEVPFMNISYDVKCDSLIRDINMEEYSLDLKDLKNNKKITSKLNYVIKEKPNIRQKLKKIKKIQYDSAIKNFEEIRRILSKNV